MAAKDLLRSELIGTELEVIDASNASLIGLKGKVIDETKYTLLIETKNKEKRIFKRSTKMRIRFKEKTIELDGSLLAGRPEDRIKKRFTI